MRVRRVRQQGGLWWLPYIVMLLGPALALLAVSGQGWTTTAAATVSAAAVISVGLAGLLERRLDKPQTARDARPACLSTELLEEWRVRLRAAILEARVEQGGTLDQMVRQGDAIDSSVTHLDSDLHRPRLRVGVGEQLRPWSEIKRQWDHSEGRLVITGDPGFGKTVAALTLVAHINGRDEPGAKVAELFSLADWYRWHADHLGSPVAGWMAEQLTLSYRDLPLEVSRQLIDHGKVLPVLDGLDEIPTLQQRRDCVDVINAYTRRAEPHRPFVLTCRAVDYIDLAPDWVGVQRHPIELVGLQPDQVGAILKDRTKGRQGWDIIRERYAAGDATLGELFRSPLHLTIALQVYRDQDPSELLELSVGRAQGRLWELLLSNTAEQFKDATPAQVRGWLEFLAAGMTRMVSQRLMLHELYLIDPDPVATLQSFRRIFGLVFGLVVTLLVGLSFGLVVGNVFALVAGLGVGLVAGLGGARLSGAEPTARARVSWRARAHYVIGSDKLVAAPAAALVAGSAVGAAQGLVDGLVVALVVAPVGALLIALFEMVSAGTEVVQAEPPARFAHKRPDAVLVASRSSGLAGGLVFGLVIGLVFGLVFGLEAGLIVGLFFGLIVALDSGLDAWLHHHWLRRRLRAQGLLPRRPREFLSWCAEPARGWLRITSSYEFRHRELRDHLAPHEFNGD